MLTILRATILVEIGASLLADELARKCREKREYRQDTRQSAE